MLVHGMIGNASGGLWHVLQRLMCRCGVAVLLVTTLPALAGTPNEVPEGGVLREVPLYGFFGDFRYLSDLRGKPLIINVWASWCEPCRAEMGSLERLAKRYAGKQFNIIGVSTDDDPAAALNFLMRMRITFDNYHDKDLLLEDMLGADTIPLTLLIDANGKILRKHHGYKIWDSKESIEMIGKTLGVKM